MFRTTRTIHVLGDSTAQVAQSPFTLPRINPQGHAATTTPQAKQGLYNAPALINTYATPRPAPPRPAPPPAISGPTGLILSTSFDIFGCIIQKRAKKEGASERVHQTKSWDGRTSHVFLFFVWVWRKQ